MSKKFVTVFIYVILAIASLFIIGKVGSYIKVTNSKAFEFTKNKLLKNDKVLNRTGEIEKFGYAYGSVTKEDAEIRTTVYGKKAKAEVIVFLTKTEENKWEVTKVFLKEIN